jgi:uncharacterized protein YsxB (DUF464 family)
MKTIDFIQLLKDYKVVIPPVQRDYAQGRQTGKIPYLRNRFLNAIFDVLSKKDSALNLDFIYGFTAKDKRNDAEVVTFKPLDGQQRLTTVFLIHWFVLNKEIKDEEKLKEVKSLLNNFSYATRNSSSGFCEKLVKYKPVFDFESISYEIENQPWFYSSWKSDPTIASMLVMLDDIQNKYSEYIEAKLSGDETPKVWQLLENDSSSIIFHLLPMDDLGLPDDLYIKMNSRGKELTNFEHFKSSFTEILSDKNAKYFSKKIDQEWSDLFWDIFKDKERKDIAQVVDDGFLNFFWYITDILIRKNNLIVSNEFWLENAKQVYEKNEENVQFLFKCINLFEELEKKSPDYFSNLFYINPDDFSTEKTRLFFGAPNINLFHKCASTYLSGGFVIREQVLLYAIIQIALNKYDIPENFYRLTRNLLEHAADKEIRNEKLKTLYEAIENLIKGERDYQKLPFTKRQLKEEKEKEELILSNESLKEIVYKLDDHTLLRGNITIFDFNNDIEKYGKAFIYLINSKNDYFKISSALLTFDDYTQKYGNNYKRFGNKNNSVWREIFTESESRKGFPNTKNILRSYLDAFIDDPDTTNDEIIDSFLKEHIDDSSKPKELRYYYVKYDSFRSWNGHNTDGYYYFFHHSEPYHCLMMFRTQFNGRHWSPFLLEIAKSNNNCSIENYGSDMQFTKGDLILMVRNTNSGFMFLAPENDDFSGKYLNELIANKTLNSNGLLQIEQDQNGIDLEDRIGKCQNLLNNLQV